MPQDQTTETQADSQNQIFQLDHPNQLESTQLSLILTTIKPQVSPANRNPITPDDVALRAASERHQNAIKGITNLLKGSLIKQRLTETKLKVTSKPTLKPTTMLSPAQRNAQNDIIAAETRVSQIITAINSLTTNIGDLTTEIKLTNTGNMQRCWSY
jgi:hypothetical protein